MQESQMLSTVTIDCQVTMIVMNSGSQFSELLSVSQMSQVSKIVLKVVKIFKIQQKLKICQICQLLSNLSKIVKFAKFVKNCVWPNPTCLCFFTKSDSWEFSALNHVFFRRCPWVSRLCITYPCQLSPQWFWPLYP